MIIQKGFCCCQPEKMAAAAERRRGASLAYDRAVQDTNTNVGTAYYVTLTFCVQVVVHYEMSNCDLFCQLDIVLSLLQNNAIFFLFTEITHPELCLKFF